VTKEQKLSFNREMLCKIFHPFTDRLCVVGQRSPMDSVFINGVQTLVEVEAGLFIIPVCYVKSPDSHL